MPRKLAIVASRATIDGAYSPFVLASTSATMDFDCRLFFTFGGLELIKREPRLEGEMPTAGEGVMSFTELRSACVEAGVGLIACRMSMELLGIGEDALIDGVDYAGAAAWLEFAADADIALYI